MIKRLTTLLLNSFVENDRFSPRYLSSFAFVGMFFWLVYVGVSTPIEVKNGILVNGWAPDFIWYILASLVFALLGLGKFVDIADKFKNRGPDTVIIEERGGRGEEDRDPEPEKRRPKNKKTRAEEALEAWKNGETDHLE